MLAIVGLNQVDWLEQENAISHLSEDSMSYRISVISVFVAIAIVSYAIGQGMPVAKSRVASDVKMSDRDKIEKLQLEVVALQKKLAALTQSYETHTHEFHLEVAQIPSAIECKQTVPQWAPAGDSRSSVDRVCRQLAYGDINVAVAPGRESIITGPPRR